MGIKGNIYGIRVNGDFINCELSCSLTVNRQMVNKSGSHSGKYRHYRAGYIDWSITADARTVVSVLSGSFNNLLDSQLSGTEIDVFISARVSNVRQIDIGGKALIPNISVGFPNSGFSTYNVTFQGVGELITDIEELDVLINAMPYSDNKDGLVVDTNTWL